MAATIRNNMFLRLSRQILGVSCELAAVPVRSMAKQCRVQRRRRPGKRLGWKRQDGSFVHAGEQLVKQKSLRFYPGENVSFGYTNDLYAATDGTVIVTAERLSPYPDSPLYGPVQEGAVVFKKFFHVLPTPLHGKFRLVSQI